MAVGGYGNGSSLELASGAQQRSLVAMAVGLLWAMAVGLLWSLAVLRSSGCWWLWQWVFFGAWQWCAASAVGGYGGGSSLELGGGAQQRVLVAVCQVKC